MKLSYGEEQLMLCVSDNGKGVPQDICGEIFEPFYTTKPNGMGMGLAIIASIVEHWHGQAMCECKEGKTSIRIVLPCEIMRPSDAQAQWSEAELSIKTP